MDLHVILIYHSHNYIFHMYWYTYQEPLWYTYRCGFCDPSRVCSFCTVLDITRSMNTRGFSGNSYWMTDRKLQSQISFGTLNHYFLQPFSKFSRNTSTFYSGSFTLSKSQIVLGKPLKVYIGFDVCLKP